MAATVFILKEVDKKGNMRANIKKRTKWGKQEKEVDKKGKEFSKKRTKRASQAERNGH